MAEIPMRSSYEATVADLNGDGFTDIVIMLIRCITGKKMTLLQAPTYSGAVPMGYDFSEEGRTVSNEFYLGSSNVADLNKDGYLDLVLGSYETSCFRSPS
jgi:hypothetical protein